MTTFADTDATFASRTPTLAGAKPSLLLLAPAVSAFGGTIGYAHPLHAFGFRRGLVLAGIEPGIGGQQAVAAVGTPLAIGLPVALERPLTRGRLELASTDPRVQPRIQLNFAAHPEDLRRLVEGVRLAWQIAHQPEIARHMHHVALLSEETLASHDDLAAYVRATVSTQFHPCGTARMGPAGDPMAVVDQHCRVRTIANLRVVDASVMPTIPRANINLTCIMIGEHVADWMRDEA